MGSDSTKKVLFKTNMSRDNIKEADLIRDAFHLSPSVIRRRSSSPSSVAEFPRGPPPAPQKLRRERADDIIETAMKLMDMVMDQNRWVKKLERCIEDNYESK